GGGADHHRPRNRGVRAAGMDGPTRPGEERGGGLCRQAEDDPADDRHPAAAVRRPAVRAGRLPRPGYGADLRGSGADGGLGVVLQTQGAAPDAGLGLRLSHLHMRANFPAGWYPSTTATHLRSWSIADT